MNPKKKKSSNDEYGNKYDGTYGNNYGGAYEDDAYSKKYDRKYDNPEQDAYEKKFNSFGKDDGFSANDLRKNEKSAGTVGTETSDDIRSQEGKSGWSDKTSPRQAPVQGLDRVRQVIFKDAKKRSPFVVVLLLLITLIVGGGFGVSLAPFMFLSNVHLDLNDPLSSLDRRFKSQMQNKIFGKNYPNDKLSLGCTEVGAALSKKCQLKTIAPWTAEKLKSQGIEVIGEKKLGGRIAPTGYKYKGVTYDASSLAEAFSGKNQELGHAFSKGINMSWIGMKAKTFFGRVLTKFGLKSDQPIELTGNEEDMKKQLMNGKASGGSSGTLNFTERKNPDTGESDWVIDGDDSGTGYSTAQKDSMLKKFETSGGFRTSLSQASLKAAGNLATTLSVLGWPQLACQLRDSVGYISVIQKVKNSKQLAGYALTIAPFIGKLQAGDINDPAEAKAVYDFFTEPDSRELITDYVKSKSGDAVEAAKVKNPDFGKTVMDSDLYKMSAGGSVVNPSETDKNYSLGLSYHSFIQSIVSGITGWDSKFTGFLNYDACSVFHGTTGKVIKGLGLAVGILKFTGELLCDASVVGTAVCAPITGVDIAQTVALGILTFTSSAWLSNWISSAMNSSLISDTMDQTPLARGAALWSGLSVLYGESSLARGMMPGNTSQILAYQQQQNTARQEYIAYEREESNPLDIHNPYSLTGSVVAAISSHFPNSLSTSSFGSLLTGVSSFVFGGLTSSLQPYTAYAASQDPSRFEQCGDSIYENAGLSPDVQCNLRYVMPEASMSKDPIAVAQYMEDHGFVEKDTTTGYPVGYSPPDAAKAESTASGWIEKAGDDISDFIKGTVNEYYNTNSYDKYNVSKQDAAGQEIGSPNGSKFAAYLDYCVYRALPFGMTYEDDTALIGGVDNKWLSGAACRYTDDEDINNFRMYVFDMSVNDDLDGPIIPDCPPGTANSTSGADNTTNAAAIDAIIAKYPSSPLNGKGNLIMEYANKYGVRADFFVTTFLAENQFATDGKSTQLYKDSFNVGNNKAGGSDVGDCGTTTYGGDTYKKYCSLESGIEGAFKSIAENSLYKDKLPTQNPLPDTKVNTVGSVRQIYCPEGDGGAEGCNLENFLTMAKGIGFTMNKDDAFYTTTGGSTTTSTSSGNKATGTKMSESELKTLITSYGLPAPQASNSNGVKGYTELLSDLTSNPKASWGAQQFLNGEKAWKSKGGDIKEYLTTAWVWIETGSWPDPYEMNCQSQTETTQATHFCNSGDFQVAGYQPNDVKDKFQDVFNKLYGSESQLPSIMENVVKNSTNASKDIWNYNDPSNSSASSYFSNLSGIGLKDIWPSTSYNDEKAQVQSLILGKDPAMAAALNSFAVTDSDVVAMLKDCKSLSWSNNSYYCDPNFRPLVANMMMALYMFDGSGPSSAVCGAAGNPRGSGTGIAAIFNGTVPGITQEFGPTDFSANNYEMYAYAAEYGMNPVGHTGIDYGVELDTKLYSPVDGTVEVAGGTPYFRSTDRLYNGGISQPGTGQLSIKMSNGDTVILGHMHKIDVKVGDKVTKGQYVGLSGTENGPHVHVEYRTPDSSTSSGERLVDPRKYL